MSDITNQQKDSDDQQTPKQCHTNEHQCVIPTPTTEMVVIHHSEASYILPSAMNTPGLAAPHASSPIVRSFPIGPQGLSARLDRRPEFSINMPEALAMRVLRLYLSGCPGRDSQGQVRFRRLLGGLMPWSRAVLPALTGNPAAVFGVVHSEVVVNDLRSNEKYTS